MKDVLFRHMETIDGYRFTVAGKFDNQTNSLDLGVSLCSNNDNFSRDIGRHQSFNRLSQMSLSTGKLSARFSSNKIWRNGEIRFFNNFVNYMRTLTSSELKRTFGINNSSVAK